MATYNFMVKHNGVVYDAGMDVPISKSAQVLKKETKIVETKIVETKNVETIVEETEKTSKNKKNKKANEEKSQLVEDIISE